MGTNTDPDQPAEGRYRLTRGLVQALSDARNPFSILTKSTMILRDLDLLVEASRHTQVRVNLSIGTLDERAWRTSEPGTPPPHQRVEAVRRLVDAGVECGVLVAPVLPGISDAPEQLEAVVNACVEAGAASISTVILHLRPGVRELFLPWLRRERPDLVATYDALYASPSGTAPAAFRHAHAGRMRELVRAAGGQVSQFETRMPAKYTDE
jgi:DNA repair photolyase